MSAVLRKITNRQITIKNSRPPSSPSDLVESQFTVYGYPGVNLGIAKDDALEGLDWPDDVFFQDCGKKITYRLLVDGYEIHSVVKHAHHLQRGQTRRTVVSHVVQVAESFIRWTETLAVLPGRPRFGPNYIELRDLYLMDLKQVSKASFQVNLGILELEDPEAFPVEPNTVWSTLDYAYPQLQIQNPLVTAYNPVDELPMEAHGGNPELPFNYEPF